MRKKIGPVWTTDLETFKAIVQSSPSRIEVLRRLGLRPYGSEYERLDQRVREEGIDVSHYAQRNDALIKVNRARRQPLEQLLIEGSKYNKQRLKQRILQAGLLENQCAICGQEPTWNERGLTLIMDHINGVPDDDRLENLRMVCPNCDSQLPTFCGRNRRAISNAKRCPDCGKVTPHGRRCRPCQTALAAVRPPDLTRAKLEREIAEHGVRELAKKYGVKEGTIRTWKRRLA